jgi:rhodanese-related sulfurtransferase
LHHGDGRTEQGRRRVDADRGGRCAFARAQYESLQRLLRLPEETLVFPGHDYKGDTVSTIGEEKWFNPRLKVRDANEYAALMASLHLPDPKMMDVAVPANMRQGLHQEEVARRGWAFTAEEAKALVGRPDVALIDLREKRERERAGEIPGSLHAPYSDLQQNVSAGGVLNELARSSGKTLVFYCAFGERSAMAVQAAQDVGITSARHIEGGMAAWTKAGGATLPR